MLNGVHALTIRRSMPQKFMNIYQKNVLNSFFYPPQMSVQAKLNYIMHLI